MKTLVLGLGNPILTDDGLGIHVVREAQSRYNLDALRTDVAFAEASVGGLRLLECISGYDRLVLVDAIQTPRGRPGDIVRLRVDDLLTTLHSGSTHDLTFPGALALGRGLHMSLPEDGQITIIAVEAQDVLTFSETCTAAVQAAIPRAVQVVLDEIAA